ncbi:hypothetical protein [uncultured Microbulbifer sp.]|uniref:hypothetical protein n=1 Tax=uncultured Microbulbifer sp. TaxID=348147 RepID=UPI00344F1C68
MDIFRDENSQYGRLLINADVSTEFHLCPGVIHAWELLAAKLSISIRVMKNCIHAIKSF